MTEHAVDMAGDTVCPKHPTFLVGEGRPCPMCEEFVPGESPAKDLATVAQAEPTEEVTGELMEAEKFEGSDVVEWEMKLPGATVECDQSFKRGSVIRMAVEVRVRNVGYVERKDGTLTRVHQATLEDISVVSSFDPSQNHENVGGGLAGTAPDEGEDGEAPDALAGLQVGRTQEAWPPAPQEATG